MPRMQRTGDNKYAKPCAKCSTLFEVEGDRWDEAFQNMRTHFSPNDRLKDGLCSYCKGCSANIMNGRRTDGPNRQDLLQTQGGKCAICKKEITFEERHNAAVDHDHATGAVRGILCYNCNRGLGHFQDDADILRAALDYLARS